MLDIYTRGSSNSPLPPFGANGPRRSSTQSPDASGLCGISSNFQGCLILKQHLFACAVSWLHGAVRSLAQDKLLALSGLWAVLRQVQGAAEDHRIRAPAREVRLMVHRPVHGRPTVPAKDRRPLHLPRRFGGMRPSAAGDEARGVQALAVLGVRPGPSLEEEAGRIAGAPRGALLRLRQHLVQRRERGGPEGIGAHG